MTPLPEPGPICPYLAIDDDAVTANVEVMAKWCARQGVALAPHAKTTMSRYVVEKQLAAGAWGLSAATVAQAGALAAFTERPLMIANQVVGDPEIDALVGWRRDVLSWVDSVAQVDALELRAAGRDRPLPVLLEVGLPGGRAGVRNLDEACAVAARVRASRHLQLRGVAGYEGSYGTGAEPAVGVDRFLDRVAEVVNVLDRGGLFTGLAEVLVTVGGSMYFDRCVRLSGLTLRDDLRVTTLLRSGCYVVHDDGLYARMTPAARGVAAAPTFRSAASVVARVQSRPEPGLALVGAGRRDLAYDQDLPVILAWHSARGVAAPGGGSVVVRLDDQHAYVRVPADLELAVGDRAVLGISHPCSVFDRWRTFHVVRGGKPISIEETSFP